MTRWILMMGCLALGGAQAQDQEQVTRSDVLLIEKVERAQGMEVPGLGMSMAQVQATWGEPETRSAAVGDPPITRWHYGEFTVYFEKQTVIHAVVHREALGLGTAS